MIIVKQVAALQKAIKKAKSESKSIGFVPTMGALHQGHLSLIQQSLRETDFTICSIFVNPVQFNDPKDFEKYPVTTEIDIQFLRTAGVDILFLPTVNELYPTGTARLEEYDLGYLSSILEGKFRPGHFQGVAQVMARLLSFTLPDKLFMGQKDYQQCMVVQRLINLQKISTQLVICATVREPDGLAMSSRNVRLDPIERKLAASIFQTLQWIKSNLKPGDIKELSTEASRQLSAKGFKVDYVQIARADNLQPVENWNGNDRLVALAAAFLNEVRLIDNLLLD